MFFGVADLTGFVGHFHPLLVHLPIGILLFALVISLLPKKVRLNMEQAFSLALLISAVSSLLACIAGYLLSLSGDYDPELVEKHQWLGIATTILSFAAFSFKHFRRLILWCTVLVMVIASHFGGTITHGEGYLFSFVNKQNSDKNSDKKASETAKGHAGSANTFNGKMITVDSVGAIGANDSALSAALVTRQVFMYRDQIIPLLESKCYACHSSIKKKGGLRLDGENFIKKGGKNGSILTNSDPSKSTLYSHLVLPLEDEKHMPPKGKKQLSRTEIALIHRWISKGAPFGAIIESASIENSNPVQGQVQSTVGTSQLAPNKAITSGIEAGPASVALWVASSTATARKGVNTDALVSSSSDYLAAIPAGDEAAIRQLNQQGVVVVPLSGGAHGLSINFVNVKNIAPSTLELLNRLADQVVELKFSNLPLGDNQLQSLAVFRNLKKLHLERTGITDVGMSTLGRYTNLESLNLYGNAITDKGLEALTSSNKLRKLYLWQTATTGKGMEAIKKSNPDLDIESGSLNLFKPDSIINK